MWLHTGQISKMTMRKHARVLFLSKSYKQLYLFDPLNITICDWPDQMHYPNTQSDNWVSDYDGEWNMYIFLTQGHLYLRNNDVYLCFIIFCIYTVRYNGSKSKHARFPQHKYFCKSVFCQSLKNKLFLTFDLNYAKTWPLPTFTASLFWESRHSSFQWYMI
jgi:hypothetical protein